MKSILGQFYYTSDDKSPSIFFPIKKLESLICPILVCFSIGIVEANRSDNTVYKHVGFYQNLKQKFSRLEILAYL